MNGPAPLSSGRIFMEPSKGATDLKGWQVFETDDAQVTIILTKPGDLTPTLLQKLTILGNVQEVSISVKKSLTGPHEQYNSGLPIQLTSANRDIVFADGGIMVYEVTIGLLAAIDHSQPFGLQLSVYACVQGMSFCKF